MKNTGTCSKCGRSDIARIEDVYLPREVGGIASRGAIQYAGGGNPFPFALPVVFQKNGLNRNAIWKKSEKIYIKKSNSKLGIMRV